MIEMASPSERPFSLMAVLVAVGFLRLPLFWEALVDG
jgi:hypothetical protein